MAGNTMTRAGRPISVLIVGEQGGCLPKLKESLEALGIRARCTQLSEVEGELKRPQPPDVIFTAMEPADERWFDVLGLASRLGKQPVIVASRVIDLRFYLDAMDRGAFDYVAAPFEPRGLGYIVDSATSKNRGFARPVQAAIARSVSERGALQC
jgi:DNA-binding NtrC family response regulator